VAATPERRCVHCGDVIPEGEGVEAKALMVMGPDGKETWFTLSEGVVPESVVPSGPPWRLELPTHQGPGACARTRARLPARERPHQHWPLHLRHRRPPAQGVTRAVRMLAKSKG